MQQPGQAQSTEQAFRCLVAGDPAARGMLLRRHQRAVAAGDLPAQWLCAAGQLMSVATDYADFRGLEPWLRHFETACREAPTIESPVNRMRIDAAWITWPSLDHRVGYDDPALRAAAQRLGACLLRDTAAIEPDECMLLFKLLVDYHSQQHDVQMIARLAAFAQELLHTAGVSPEAEGRWWLQMTLNHEYFGDPGAAREALQRAVALAKANDLKTLRFETLCIEMNSALKDDDLARCERIAAELDRLRPAVRAGRVPQGLRAQALYLARKGEIGAALQRVDLLLAICADVQVPERECGAYHVLRSNCLTGLQRHDEALQALHAIRAQQSGSQGELLVVIETLADAARWLDRDPAAARALVAQGFRGAARLKWNRFLLPLPALAGRMAEIALDDGVEPEFVAAAVRERRLRPSDPAREAWPWRLHLYGLGELRLLRDGEVLRTAGVKAPRKPLELLGALVAHGGQAFDIDAMVDALWPSLAANAPKASFEMALSRLRKLLDVPDAVQVVDGMVSLNPALVWCDTAAFEQLAQRHSQAVRSAADVRDADALAERMLALYRDRLLGTEELASPLLALRERLALKFARVMLEHGARLEARADWRAAVLLYERALAQDMLCEPLYRALMRAHVQLGERAEAVRCYHRCRELLSRVLGLAPAPQTHALYCELSEAG